MFSILFLNWTNLGILLILVYCYQLAVNYVKQLS